MSRRIKDSTLDSTSHMPSWGYVAYLLTGRWLFMELNRDVDLYHHFRHSYLDTWRNTPTGIWGQGRGPGVPHGVTRNKAWTMRCRAHAATIQPDAGVDTFDAEARGRPRHVHSTRDLWNTFGAFNPVRG